MTYNFLGLQIGLSQENSKKIRRTTHIFASTTMMFDRFQLTGKCQTDLSYRSRAKVSAVSLY